MPIFHISPLTVDVKLAERLLMRTTLSGMLRSQAAGEADPRNAARLLEIAKEFEEGKHDA